MVQALRSTALLSRLSDALLPAPLPAVQAARLPQPPPRTDASHTHGAPDGVGAGVGARVSVGEGGVVAGAGGAGVGAGVAAQIGITLGLNVEGASTAGLVLNVILLPAFL